MTNFSSISYIFLFAKNYCQISPSWRIYQSSDVIQAHEEPQDWKLYKADARADCSLDRLHAFHLVLLQELSLFTCTCKVVWDIVLNWAVVTMYLEKYGGSLRHVLQFQPVTRATFWRTCCGKVDSGRDAFDHELIMAEMFTYKTVLLCFDNMTPTC